MSHTHSFNHLVNADRRVLLKQLGVSAMAFSQPFQCNLAHSQTLNWPIRPVRFIVPFVPGGTSDIVARTTANELTRLLPFPVVIENKSGGGGVPAMQEVARSAADGHTLILGHVGSMAVNPLIFPNSGYDVNKDFTPITLLAKVPSLFVIHPDVPAKNFTEFVSYVKRNPGKLNYGSAGNASAGHLAMEYLKLTTGLFMTHIPYRGTGPALTDLLAGRTQVFQRVRLPCCPTFAVAD